MLLNGKKRPTRLIHWRFILRLSSDTGTQGCKKPLLVPSGNNAPLDFDGKHSPLGQEQEVALAYGLKFMVTVPHRVKYGPGFAIRRS